MVLWSQLLGDISRNAMRLMVNNKKCRIEGCGTDKFKFKRDCLIRPTYRMSCACLVAKKLLYKKLIHFNEIHLLEESSKYICFSKIESYSDAFWV